MLPIYEPALQESAVAQTSLLDYITLGGNVLFLEHCQRLIDRFEARKRLKFVSATAAIASRRWGLRGHD
jgi:hypothetical protein